MQTRKGSHSVRVLAGALLALAALVPASRANYARVEDVSARELDVGAGQMKIEIDVSWDNSWRNALNHDAVWIFAKFRVPGGEWQHAYLSTNDAAHSAPGGVVEVGTSPVEVSEGVTNQLGVGAFLYSGSHRSGNVSYPGVQLTWDFSMTTHEFQPGDEILLSVHAIEMVYVPEGGFYLGSGATDGPAYMYDASGEFTDGSWASGAGIPFHVGSEDPITITNSPGYLWARNAHKIGAPAVDALPAEFPKGHAAFYCMKYPITQGQYAEFLCLLTDDQAGNRLPPAGSAQAGMYDPANFTISGAWPNFAASAPDLICNTITWPHTAAYLAWAGLRPLTELEFEKACRGPELPVPHEYPWGTANRFQERAIFIGGDAYHTGRELASHLADGSELGGNVHGFWDGGQLGTPGPLRAGIFAATAAARGEPTRQNAGASFWGIMDLSGGPSQRYVSVHDNGRGFTGEHGPGALCPDGNAVVPGWPGLPPDATAGLGMAFRGSPGWFWWNFKDAMSRTTSQRNLAGGDEGLGEARTAGGRGGRTAPAPE